jgi:hypothetical protein
MAGEEATTVTVSMITDSEIDNGKADA